MLVEKGDKCLFLTKAAVTKERVKGERLINDTLTRRKPLRTKTWWAEMLTVKGL